MRILLFGANGQVGHELRRSLAPLGEVVCTTRSGRLGDGAPCEAADFARPGTLAPLIARIAPDVVVNAAAYTAVDRAEDEPAAAYAANASAPQAIAAACAQRDLLMVHYSTDYVFDGTATRPYREDDPTCPLGVYGASKLAGEQAIQDSGARHMIFRTAWVYAAHGSNFLRTMLRLAGERDELRVVADQVGAPTPASLIADVSSHVLGQAQGGGILHLVAGGETSWHGFALEIVTQAYKLGLIARLPRMEKILTPDYPTRAQRPAFSVLDTRRLVDRHAVVLPAWHALLPRVLAEVRRS
ncbi:MAG: dTDP-4-dehydrorhamnose reductase [Luteimonas sp.]